MRRLNQNQKNSLSDIFNNLFVACVAGLATGILGYFEFINLYDPVLLALVSIMLFFGSLWLRKDN